MFPLQTHTLHQHLFLLMPCGSSWENFPCFLGSSSSCSTLGSQRPCYTNIVHDGSMREIMPKLSAVIMISKNDFRLCCWWLAALPISERERLKVHWKFNSNPQSVHKHLSVLIKFFLPLLKVSRSQRASSTQPSLATIHREPQISRNELFHSWFWRVIFRQKTGWMSRGRNHGRGRRHEYMLQMTDEKLCLIFIWHCLPPVTPNQGFEGRRGELDLRKVQA